MTDDDGSSLRGAVRKFVSRTLTRRRVQGGFDLADEDVGDEEHDAVGELPMSEERGVVGAADGRRRSINLGRRHSQRLERANSMQSLSLSRIKSRWGKFSASNLDLATFHQHDEDFQVNSSGRLRLNSAPDADDQKESDEAKEQTSKGRKFLQKVGPSSDGGKKKAAKQQQQLKQSTTWYPGSELCLSTADSSLGSLHQQWGCAAPVALAPRRMLAVGRQPRLSASQSVCVGGAERSSRSAVKTVESKETRGGGGAAASAPSSQYEWGRRMLGSLRRKKPKSEPPPPAPPPSAPSAAPRLCPGADDERPASPQVGSPRSEQQRLMREDFLRATMRIFLVVSPPMGGRMQARSRSLTHLDALDGGSAGAKVSQSAGGTDASCSIDASPCGAAPLDLQASALAAAATLLRQQPSDDEHMDQHNQRLVVPSSQPARDRRRTLSRSQVSSAEFFSVSFEGVDVEENLRTEFIPATKGVSLADALSEACDRRKLELNSLDAFLDTGKKALQLSGTDTQSLGGRHLIICAKGSGPPSSRLVRSTPSSSHPPSRKTSGGVTSYKSKGSRFFSVSTEDASSAAPDQQSHFEFKLPLVKQTSKQPWSAFFGANKQEAKYMDMLVDQLNIFSRFGSVEKSSSVPSSMSSSSCDHTHERLFLNLYDLEEDWRDLVHSSDELSEKLVQQQTAIWELAQTELSYIHILQVVKDLFIACLRHLQAEHLLEHVDPGRLFSNITEIYEVNIKFWLNYIQPLIDRTRATGHLFDPSLMLPGFLRFEELFSPYTRYCSDQQEQCQQYCREHMQTSELFMAYLAWCEAQRECKRLRLLDILVKPMQRLTKYSLLLKAILKNTEDTDQKMDLSLMIKHVDHFVSSVNTSLRMQQDEERLRCIAARVSSYDVMHEIKDEDLEKLVKAHSELNLNTPMPGCTSSQFRQLLFEGQLVLKEHSKSKVTKVDVYGLLLSDILLLCKVTSNNKKLPDTYKVVRQPFVVDRLQLVEIVRDTQIGLGVVYLNEYHTAVAAFSLFSNDKAINIKTWADKIRKAQHAYKQAKSAARAAETAAALAAGMMHPEMTDDGIEDSAHCFTLSTGVRSHGSSRMPSLFHSHSGSVEMTEGSSFNPSRGVSLEMEAGRGSSLSSDEGSSGGDMRLTLTPPHATSPLPRCDRRSPIRSPNMLGVHHLAHAGGQSLPNLSLSESSPSAPTSPAAPPLHGAGSLLSVPTGKGLSPQHRGVSYPPPSPRALRRSYAVPQSRNPPLLKSRHVLGAKSANDADGSVDVPLIAGVSPPKDLHITQCSSFSAGDEDNACSNAYRQAVSTKRQNRVADSRRYHTAGIVDDLKKLDSRDPSIHKRLSWNCAAGPSGLQQQQLGARAHGLSTESVQSSSGVSSSTGSQAMLYQNDLEQRVQPPPQQQITETPTSPLPALKVCPATPLLKAVEEDQNSPGGDAKKLDTVEQIVEAFNLEMIQVAMRDEECEPPPVDSQQQKTDAHADAAQQQQWWSDSMAPSPASPSRSRNNSTNSDKNDLHGAFDSSEV